MGWQEQAPRIRWAGQWLSWKSPHEDGVSWTSPHPVPMVGAAGIREWVWRQREGREEAGGAERKGTWGKGEQREDMGTCVKQGR